MQTKIYLQTKMNKEVRFLNEGIGLNEDGRTVHGYAVRFNTLSQDLGFYEMILPEAITQDTINSSDIYARFNHRDDIVLARSRYGVGSLKLELRADGLYYEFEAPNTVYGDELLEHIKRGELAGSSFAFHCSEDKWEKRDGILYRTITKIDILADVSPVFEPAYLDTYVDKRGINDLEDKEYEDYIINKMDTHLNEIFEMVR